MKIIAQEHRKPTGFQAEERKRAYQQWKPDYHYRGIIPAPKTKSWEEYYGNWTGFCKAIEASIGRKIDGGVLVFWTSSEEDAKKANR